MMIKALSKVAALVAVAGGLNLAVVTPTEALDDPNPAVGRRCSFASITDPTIENGETQTGQINAGPTAATAPAATISVRCTIQVGAANSTHAGADSCSAESAPSVQVAVVPPTLCSYLSPEGQPVYMCSQITVNGKTYYWDAGVANSAPSRTVIVGWKQDPNGSCNLAISQEIFPGPLPPVIVLLDEVLCEIFEEQLDGSAVDNDAPLRFGPTPNLDDEQPGAAHWNDVYIDHDNDPGTPPVLFWDCPEYEL